MQFLEKKTFVSNLNLQLFPTKSQKVNLCISHHACGALGNDNINNIHSNIPYSWVNIKIKYIHKRKTCLTIYISVN